MKLEDIQKHTLIRIVDDDTDLLEATELMLTFSGWRVKCYASASEFLAGDAPSDPGCLILDIRMSDMTGIELQAELNARHYDLPIIVLTGHANVDIAVTTFLLSLAAVQVGKLAGDKFSGGAQKTGGLVLLLIGIKLLFEAF